MVNCKICDSETKPAFRSLLLNKYDVQYYKCPSCYFLQTEKPYWLTEAYETAITSQDIGLLYRNRITLPILKSLIKLYFNKSGKFLDYGGGYGVLVRSMRDCGFDMYRFDKFCINLFAAGFDDDSTGTKYELITAFEVFEHLENPVEELEKMLLLGDHVFFSTEIQPNLDVSPENWWYVMPETGQHISLYSLSSLKALAQKFNLNFYSNGINFHLFTRKKLNTSLFKFFLHYKMTLIIDAILPGLQSKLQQDYKMIVEKNKERAS